MSTHARPHDDHASHAPVHAPVKPVRPPGEERWNPGVGLLLDHGFALVLCLGLILIGVWLSESSPGKTNTSADIFQAVGALGMIVVLAIAPITWQLRKQAAARAGLARKTDALLESIRRLGESNSLSDDARRVLNRGAERNLLCKAIEEDIHNQAWDAALVLCDELADRFGYRQDAEEFRARIDLARHEIQERKVADAIARLDGLIVQRRWDVAQREAMRVRRLYPDAPRTEKLRERVEQARAVYKADLERRFLEAAQANRVDEAMVLLKELDAYLTETEAEPLRELARGVIGKARDNLGAQFKIAVHDRQWATAAALGRKIVNEFPNTRMAAEVRGLLDGILAKANQPAGTGEPLTMRN